MSSPLQIAYFAIKYPTLSQTFIRREVETLYSLGLRIEVHPLWDFRGEKDEPPPPAICRLGIADYLLLPLRLLIELVRCRKRLPAAWRILRAHWPSFGEGWFMTLWGAAFALQKRAYFAKNVPDVFHGAWATGPATTAAILAVLFDRPFSFGAHAYDVHRHGGDPLLQLKLRHAAFVHTTTNLNLDYLKSKVPGANVVLSRRGLPALPPDPGPREIHTPVRLLSVGRLVPKKAHEHQLRACAELKKRGIPFELRIAGEGPLRPKLEEQIADLGLQQEVHLLGSRSPAQVQEEYGWADIFWHTGVVDSQGDRDGLPNVVPEAMSHRIPVISCPEPGVTEAVLHEKTGLVVNTGDAVQLADAVERLMKDPALAQRFGQHARLWVTENFLSKPNACILRDAFLAAAAAGA